MFFFSFSFSFFNLGLPGTLSSLAFLFLRVYLSPSLESLSVLPIRGVILFVVYFMCTLLPTDYKVLPIPRTTYYVWPWQVRHMRDHTMSIPSAASCHPLTYLHVETKIDKKLYIHKYMLSGGLVNKPQPPGQDV
jgi:hypothetical protein